MNTSPIKSVKRIPNVDTYDITIDTDSDLNRNFVANGIVVHNSNGIEPSFAHTTKRNVIVSGRATKEQMDVYSYEALLWRSINGDAPLPDYFVTADQVPPREHVDMQAAAQPWIDSSISKTINCPTDIPFDEFQGIYLYAYERG